MSPWARSASCSPSKCRAWRAPTSNGTGCSNFTQTLVIDEDGIYDPADFNDSLILGMKGTFAQAELHLIRARLHGGKLHKAAKGELRFSLPVGLVFEGDTIVLDPDQEVQGAVRSVFQLFEREGTAYAVVRRFQDLGLRFPRRSYGGAWNGRLIWGRLTHSRVLGILANPSYAGAYVFGRYQSSKQAASPTRSGRRITRCSTCLSSIRRASRHARG